MGWCSWNAYHRNFNETVFYETADAMKANGMQAAGYEYINVDGGWWNGSDTGHIGRNATGYFEYNSHKYPHGIRAVADYIHDRGFKYGHYTDSGLTACNRDKPMSQGFEHQDAFLFALEYGADMVKVDACAATLPAEELMTRWKTQLNATGRPVLFSNCHNGCETDGRHDPSSLGGWLPWCAELSNMWRSSRDISAKWSSIMHNLDSLKGRGKVAGPGHWNDPDFLEVGVEGMALTPTSSQQKLDENVAHMTMWSVTSSPLIAGLRMAAGGPGGGHPNATALAILMNADAIRINQQYCDESDCGIANGGDLLSQLQIQAGGVVAEAAPHLVMRAYPTLGECDGKNKWQLSKYSGGGDGAGFLCKLGGGGCFNMQQCSSTVMINKGDYGPKLPSGCQQGSNTLFAITAAGQLTTRMNGPLLGQCLVPVGAPVPQGGGLRLQALNCSESARGQKWRIDPKTHELIWESADSVKCVAIHAKPPQPPHPKPPDPEAAGLPETWAKPLPGREAAVAFLNRGNDPAAFSLTLSEIPWLPKGVKGCVVRDVWAEKNTTTGDGGVLHYPAVRSHQVVLLRLSDCH